MMAAVEGGALGRGTPLDPRARGMFLGEVLGNVLGNVLWNVLWNVMSLG